MLYIVYKQINPLVFWIHRFSIKKMGRIIALTTGLPKTTWISLLSNFLIDNKNAFNLNSILTLKLSY